MLKIVKVLLLVVAGWIILFAGVVVAFWLLALPSKGQALAQAAGIPRPVVIAHRGASYLAPEATHAAYVMARELGVDYLELDIQRTQDGVLVALHDDTLERTSNVAEIFPDRVTHGVDTFTFAELQQLDAGAWFNQRFPERGRKTFNGLRVLRLDDILSIAEGAPVRMGVCIESKHAHRFPGIEEQMVRELRQRGWIRDRGTTGRAEVIFQSFDPDSLKQLKVLAPHVPRILLIDEILMGKLGWKGVLKTAEEVATGLGTWGYAWARGPEWSVSAGSRYVTRRAWYTIEAHRAGLLVHPWSIDDWWEMWVVSLGGADGIFTNRSDLAMQFYHGASKPDIEALWRKLGY
jgi:glycerophosphoryl diester phosphodiesterase